MICKICVLDNSIKSLKINNFGICNYCEEFIPIINNKKIENKNKNISEFFNKIKKINSNYNCLIGVSGGVDSSFLVHLAKKENLRPLLLHFDNGWNSELAVSNIKKIASKCNFDLETYVVNWFEFKEIQRSFFKAGVIDIELVTDHAIFANLINTAKKKSIKYILSGTNIFTEHAMPPEWMWRKTDFKNIKSIHYNFSDKKIVTYPHMNFFSYYISKHINFYGVKLLEPLNFINYEKKSAIEILKKEYDWKEYQDKHFESFFTKFYQAYILIKKFKVDKRKSHLSCLIRNSELTREEALNILSNNSYPGNLDNDIKYFCKKLDFNMNEFEKIMNEEIVPHIAYNNSEKIFKFSKKIFNFFKKI
jgi:hypothetical protein